MAAAYDRLGFAAAADGDEVFRQLVLARIIEPTSKLDSLRVLEEAGIAPVSYRTLKWRLPGYAADAWRERLAALCAHHVGLGPATLLLYDVTTLYFETDAGDGVPRVRVLQGTSPGTPGHQSGYSPTRLGSRS